MKRLPATLSALALLLFAGAAGADEITAKVQTIDLDGHKLMLDNGVLYTVDAKLKLDELTEGQVVKVTYKDEEAGKKTVSDIQVMQPKQ